MEKAIVDLVDESCLAYEKNDTKLVRNIYILLIKFNINIFRHLKKLKKQCAMKKVLVVIVKNKI